MADKNIYYVPNTCDQCHVSGFIDPLLTPVCKAERADLNLSSQCVEYENLISSETFVTLDIFYVVITIIISY